MDFKQRTITLEQIDREDQFYRISDCRDLTELTRSIKRFGLITPPIVVRKNTQWIVVSGFARIEALRQSGADSFCARELPETTPLKECIGLAITEKVVHGQLTLTEQSRAVHLISNLSNDTLKITKLADYMGLSVNKELCEKLLLVSKMPAHLQDSLSKETIALPVAIRIFSFREQDAVLGTATLLDTLNLSLNRQRELLDWIEAIAMREHLAIPAVVEHERVQSVLLDSKVDLKQRATRIRQVLKQWRYPAITDAENRFMEYRQALTIPKNAQLIPPAGFESLTYTLKISFDSKQSLQSFHDDLRKTIDSPALKQLLEPFV